MHNDERATAGGGTEPALTIEGLVVEYRTEDGVVQAVNGLDLSIGRGETLGLVGETGAGKTTTALSILNMIPSPPGAIVAGKILLNGEDVLAKGRQEMGRIRGQQISMIFQDPMTALNPVMTVERQIAEVIDYHLKEGAQRSVLRARQMLELVGIPGDRGGEYPHQFSGGMRQRVVIAMALACNPQLLIADEPTTALDVTIQAQVLEMMKALREKYGTSLLMITHNLGIIAETCDYVSIIYAGRVVEHGRLEDIFEKALHPYTEGLFNSLPNVEDRSVKLKPIKGLMSDPFNLPPGCAFAPRCDYAVAGTCDRVRPGRSYRTDRHFVECHLYDAETVGKGTRLGR